MEDGAPLPLTTGWRIEASELARLRNWNFYQAFDYVLVRYLEEGEHTAANHSPATGRGRHAVCEATPRSLVSLYGHDLGSGARSRTHGRGRCRPRPCCGREPRVDHPDPTRLASAHG